MQIACQHGVVRRTTKTSKSIVCCSKVCTLRVVGGCAATLPQFSQPPKKACLFCLQGALQQPLSFPPPTSLNRILGQKILRINPAASSVQFFLSASTIFHTFPLNIALFTSCLHNPALRSSPAAGRFPLLVFPSRRRIVGRPMRGESGF